MWNKKSCQGKRLFRKVRGWTKWLMLGMILGMLGLTGCAHGGDPEERATEMVETLSRRLDLQPVQKTEVTALKEVMLSFHKTMRDVRQAAFQEALAQLKSGQTDAQKLKDLMLAQETKIDQLARQAADQFAKTLQTLTPEQRTKLSNKLEKLMQRHEDRQGFWGEKRGERRLEHLTDMLDLSETQAEQVKAWHKDLEPQREKGFAFRKAVAQEVLAQIKSGQANADQLYGLFTQHRNDLRALGTGWIDMMSKVQGILTPEQLQTLVQKMEKMQARGGERWGRHGGCRAEWME